MIELVLLTFPILIFACFVWLFVILCTMALASRRNRSAIVWGLLAVVFGLFAMIFLACLPSRRPRKSTWEQLTTGWRWQPLYKTSPNPYRDEAMPHALSYIERREPWL